MKFVVLRTVKDETKKKVENRKVCNVTEYLMRSPDGGIYKAWIGSTEDEWFSVTFVKGVLSISITEREMCLGWEVTNYAMVEHLFKNIIGKVGIEQENFVIKYNMIGYLKDIDEMTFKDAMKVFNWKFKSRDVKVDTHFLN